MDNTYIAEYKHIDIANVHNAEQISKHFDK